MARFEEGMESMVDTYIFETIDLLEHLDEILMQTETASAFTEENINEIFRIMHTIKGSSAMMGLNNISVLAHAVEDMFFIIREDKPIIASMKDLFDLVFRSSDLLKAEVDLLQDDSSIPTDFSEATANIKNYVEVLRKGDPAPAPAPAATASSATPTLTATATATQAEGADRALLGVASGTVVVRVFFEDDCKMENLRALMLVKTIQDDCQELEYEPADVESNPDTCRVIIEHGFILRFKPHDGNADIIVRQIEEALNVKSYEVVSDGTEPDEDDLLDLEQPDATADIVLGNTANGPVVTPAAPSQQAATISAPPVPATIDLGAGPTGAAVADINKKIQNKSNGSGGSKQSLISVNLNKLDQLMDMVGEIVITEAMVTANPDLKGLHLDNFQKSARQLRKLTDEMQDIVMSIRMVPLSGAFNKMTRIVRDMKVRLGKDVELRFEGEETEVDKSIIDNLNDPLMHMVRNSVDHGIEDDPQERIRAGKPAKGTVTLSAYNSSGDVIIVISDDGSGIDTEKVLDKAERNGILTKPRSQYTEKEACNLIMLAGFSTNEVVTEFSGRGVGMDVVRSNIEKVGGSVSVESKLGIGTNFIIKIPLSLSIVDGMEVSVGSSIFTIPVNSIQQSFKLEENQLLRDTQNNEMIMIRGECYPLIRLYEIYGLMPNYTDLHEGIIILVEADGRSVCIFADELLGEQQVVVKPFSPLLNDYNVKQNGMAGCTILGDGSITIILDIHNIISNF